VSDDTFSPAKATTDVVSKAAPMAIIADAAFVPQNLIIVFSFAVWGRRPVQLATTSSRRMS